ncbi:hypothetical protein ACRC6Q_18880 [Planococcus sp. SE5232]|uniref:hypothetical protein n=1 Tax=unclassified Planococcus (in: firmicutes) TaxID=2662419 RepID=UPI003D6BBCBF
MEFDYKNVGDILYAVENFKFRVKGKETADITLLNFLDDDLYAYDIQLDKSIPAEFKHINSANSRIYESLEIEFKSVFNDKKEALQHAINVINEIMLKTEKV